MKLEGSREVETGKENVWKFISKAGNLAECLPDTKSYDVVDENTIKAELKVGVGFIKEVFDSTIKYGDVDAEAGRMKLTIAAKAKSNSANVEIDITVDGNDSSSRIGWTVNAVMAGKLASIGGRYISKAADKIIDKSFQCMTAKLLAEN